MLKAYQESQTKIQPNRISYKLINIKLFDAHSGSSFIKIMKENISYLSLFSIFTLYSLIGYSLISYNIFIILFSVILVAILVVKILKRKLGFVNGDILGTSLEVSEIIGLFSLILLSTTI